MKQPVKRATVAFGPHIQTLLDAGHCGLSTRTKQLETLAGRYLAMIKARPSWQADTWVNFIRYAAATDLSAASAPYAIAGMAKHDREPKLPYALESLDQAKIFAAIAVAELYFATSQPLETAEIEAFLRENALIAAA